MCVCEKESYLEKEDLPIIWSYSQSHCSNVGVNTLFARIIMLWPKVSISNKSTNRT